MLKLISTEYEINIGKVKIRRRKFKIKGGYKEIRELLITNPHLLTDHMPKPRISSYDAEALDISISNSRQDIFRDRNR